MAATGGQGFNNSNFAGGIGNIQSVFGRTDTAIIAESGDYNTDLVTELEGADNLYYTDDRARNAVSAGTGIDYDPDTGVISAEPGSSGVSSLALGTSGSSPNLSAATGDITLNIPYADSSKSGIVSQSTQYFSGDKQFLGSIFLNARLVAYASGPQFDMITSQGVLRAAIKTLTSAAAVTLDCNNANTYTITPDQDLTINASNIPTTSQKIILFINTSGTTSFTVTFGTGFRMLVGTLVTGVTSGVTYQIELTGNGTSLIELNRTTAIS